VATPGLLPDARRIVEVLNAVYETDLLTRCRILSSSEAMPSGRCRPSALGMYALRDGLEDRIQECD
jgi:hypothetical protein